MLEQLGRTDIYLIDQLMRGRILSDCKILDAGCGSGRNSRYFITNNFDLYAIDQQEEAIAMIREHAHAWNSNFPIDKLSVSSVEDMPFTRPTFDFIISSAVLHFAQDRQQFTAMFDAMARALNDEGILWIRMTAKHTLAHLSTQVEGDVYDIPDGSRRYLLDRPHLESLMQSHKLVYADPFKTVNVDDVRTMSVIALRKTQ